MPAYLFAIWLFLALLGQTAPPQENAPTQGKLMTFRELLQQRHIELTTASLVQVLKNPDDRVRYLAALVLAEDKSTEAVPQIESALKSEKVPETKVNMALALAQFGDQDGFAVLKSACDDRGTPASIRLYAAAYMLDLDNESCLSAVLEVLQSKGA
jgi:HEAT repeat protein